MLVNDGDTVEEGDPLVVLEAMKMEHAVCAPCAGTVSELQCHVGAQIPDGFTLVVIQPAQAAVAA